MRGGARKGAGRKARPTPKAKGIWCGQIPEDKRDFIIRFLTPEERFEALMEAANKSCSKLGVVYQNGDGLEFDVSEPFGTDKKD